MHELGEKAFDLLLVFPVDHHESLVTAIAPEYRIFGHDSMQVVRKNAQGLITDSMTVEIVNGFEVVNVTYIYLGGSVLLFQHFSKAVLDVILSSVLCLIVLFPVRRLILGPKSDTMVLKNAPVVFSKT